MINKHIHSGRSFDLASTVASRIRLVWRTGFSTVLIVGLVASSGLAQARTGGQGGAAAGGGASAQPGGDRPSRGGGGGGGFGMGMMGGMGERSFEPSITTEEMTRYGKVLELTKEQQQAVTSLHEAFLQSFTAKAKLAQDKTNDLREQIRETRDFTLWQQFGEEMGKFRTERSALEASFFDDVKSILTPEQSPKFAVVDQTRRREKTLSRATMSGTNVNLVKLIGDLKLTPEVQAKVQPTLDQYALELDKNLIEFNKIRDEMEANFRQMMQAQDTEGMAKAFDKGRGSAMKLRDINQRFARELEASLPEDQRAQFDERVKRDAFPQVYRPSYAARMTDFVQSMPDLTAEQKTSVSSILESYKRDAGAMNKQLEVALAKREETVTGAEIFSGRGGGGGGFGGMMAAFDSEEIRGLRDRRRTLDDATVERVRSTLTESQRATLPTREELRQRGDGASDSTAAGGGSGGTGADRPQRRRGNGARPD